MPLFYLHLHNTHVDASDEEGHDLPDLAAARVQAIAGIRDFIGHEALNGTLGFCSRVDIADARQAISLRSRSARRSRFAGSNRPT